jgi:tetratricopeptide (TPR) repeat protein
MQVLSAKLPTGIALLLAIAAPCAAGAAASAVEEIPITTSVPAARMDFIAGRAALDKGDGPEANALFRAAVSADPDFTYAWLNLANASFSTEEFASSLKRAAASAAKASEGERLLVEIAQRFLDGNFEAQHASAKRLVAKYPRSQRALLALAAVEGNLARFEEQRAALRRAIDLDPSFAPAHLALGNSYLFNEPTDFAEAEKHYRHTIDLDPRESNFQWALGDVYRGTNRLEEAREYYKRATLLDPHDGTALLKLGHVNSFLGDYDEARADYDRGVAAAEPANKPFFASFKMFSWVYAGEPQTALAALEKLAADTEAMELPADQRDGAKAFALTNAVTIGLHSGLHDDAERVLGKLAEVLRGNARVVGTDVFSNIQEAQIAYLEGQLAARRGDFAEAERLAGRYSELVAAQKNPRKMENHHELVGLTHLLQNRHREAVAEYRQANLTNIYVKYHLALALEGAGQADEARTLFREIGTNNFNTVGFALVRKDALARAG